MKMSAPPDLNDISDILVDQLCSKIQTMSINLIRDLLCKWNEMYELSEEEKSRRLQKLIEYLQGFYCDILQCEEEKRLDFLQKIENKMKECYKLQKDLAMNEEIDLMEIKTPYTKFLKDIDKSMAYFLEEKDKRIERGRKLRAEERELCEELGLPPLPCSTNSIITEQQLDVLQLRVFELHEEKINRLKTYKDTRTIIINLSNLLEREPSNQLEKGIFADSEEHLQLSSDNMRRLEDIKYILQQQHDEITKRRHDLLDKLTKLWDRLKVTPEDRESFLVHNNTISKTHMAAIEAEIDRCEQLKRDNMRQVIESAREQISALWDKLTYTQDLRLQFKPFLTNHYSEDVLDLHELEIERLHHFYLTNQHIFELAEKRNNLWERMLHLDELAQDKNRLFSNRGGQLLKEEKERKDLEVKLPKVDMQLKTALMEYGQPFLWHGKDLLQMITTDWEERLSSKVSQQLTRKIANRKPLGMENINLMGSQCAKQLKRGALTPSSGGGHSKMRRCDFTDSTTTPKRGARTPLGLTKTPTNSSNSSLASFKQFQEGIEKSGTRAVLREVGNTPKVAQSSPMLVTPRRRATPSSSKKTPQTIPRLAYCRKRLPIDVDLCNSEDFLIPV